MNLDNGSIALERNPAIEGDDALQAYLRADYGSALRSLRAIPASEWRAENSILEARALLRLGDPSAAAAAATTAGSLAKSADESVLSLALLASALHRDGNAAQAAAAFRRARDAARAASRTIRAELGHYEALAAWTDGDTETAERLIERALPDGQDVVAALLLQLRGWIDIRRERYEAAAERFQAALRAATRSRYRDLHLEARLIHALAVIATETIDLALAERVDGYDETFAWSATLARERFNTTTCRRFAALLRGDLDEAYRLGLRALAEAPTDAFAAIAHTNQGSLSRFVGDAFSARYHFAAALSRISATQWPNADIEEHVALANYAIEAAQIDPAGAARCLTIYRSVCARERGDLVLERDRRLVAFGEFAEGRVAEALGDTQEAAAWYERSLDRWTTLGYRLRAALVALDLARLAKASRPRAELAHARALAPRAWFAGVVPEQTSQPEGPRLTRAQRRVLSHLLEGKASKEIAQALGRSDYTIRNQTKCIFRAFNVRSRAALLVRCQRDGITAERASA